MSERDKRVFRFLLDPERDADVIGRIETQPSMTGYVRELVRRDVHDERLDFAMLKASELEAENAKLREERDMYRDLVGMMDHPDLNVQLQAENAKLRKLLLDVWNDAMQFDGFWDYVNDDGEIYREDELPHYQERMRELGIEVN